jgi:hypothetical protein
MSKSAVKMLMNNVTYADAGDALDRLLEVARHDTGQSGRVASFLLSWWDGAAGGAPIIDIAEVDRDLREDMLIIIAYLAQNGVSYADAWGRKEEMGELIDRWNWKGRGNA